MRDTELHLKTLRRFNVKGKNPHDGSISGSVSTTITRKNFRAYVDKKRVKLEGKYADKASGKLHTTATNATEREPRLTIAGVTFTQTWTTANSLDTKVELDNNITQGLKAEILTNYLPDKQSYGGKVNLFYKQPSVHTRLFADVFKGPTATFDATIGHEGFLVGGEAGYDVSKAAITKYALALGYSQSTYAAAITATNNLSLFSASYYHKVNTEVEAGAKATWDSAQNSNVGLEVAGKYKLDPSSFAKVRIITFSRSPLLTCAGQDQRPWYCCSRLQRQARHWQHPWPRYFFRYPELQPGLPQGRYVVHL